MSRRDQEKKRRRLKRLQKRQRHQPATDNAHDPEESEDPLAFLRTLKGLLELPAPAHWPGSADPALARPDMVKLDLAEWAANSQPGKSKLEQLETGFQNGVLGFLQDMQHWAMEEFFWHGLPGDPWHPIDAYLASAGDRYPPPARVQLCRWKEARLSLFEIGEVRDELAELREWDPFAAAPSGPWLRVLALNIGGVNYYRDKRGHFTLTYVAPWAPQESVSCAMGYGIAVARPEINLLLPYLGMRHPEIISRPMPWKVSRRAEVEHLQRWRTRAWHRWLEERVQFPFRALVLLTPHGKPQLRTIARLLPSTPDEAREFGIYFEVPLLDDEMVAIGATAVTPLDVTAPALAALREYSAYRQRVGPPPGTIGRPRFFWNE
jgi:hypothetical protein